MCGLNPCMSAVNPADWERCRATGTSGGPPRRFPYRPSLVQQLVDAAQSDDLDAGGDGRSGEVRRWDDDAADFQPAHGICGETVTSFQVCTGTGFPAIKHPAGVAVEPQTAYANAFNTGKDLIVIKPGETSSTALFIGMLD